MGKLSAQTVLILEDVWGKALGELADVYRIERDSTVHDDPQLLSKRTSSASALIVRNRTEVNAKLIESAPNLKVIGPAGDGLDNISMSQRPMRLELSFRPLVTPMRSASPSTPSYSRLACCVI